MLPRGDNDSPHRKHTVRQKCNKWKIKTDYEAKVKTNLKFIIKHKHLESLKNIKLLFFFYKYV